jgi:hypothetical protein
VTVDLTDDERQALIDLLTAQIQESRYPLAPRVARLRRVLGKLGSDQPAKVASDPAARKRKPRR